MITLEGLKIYVNSALQQYIKTFPLNSYTSKEQYTLIRRLQNIREYLDIDGKGRLQAKVTETFDNT